MSWIKRLWSNTTEQMRQGRPEISTLLLGGALTGVCVAIALFPLKRQHKTQFSNCHLSLPGHAKHMCALDAEDIQDTLKTYTSFYSKEGKYEATERTRAYMTLQDCYWNLFTDIFLNHWSESFHFGDRYTYETLGESLRRAEYLLCLRLGMRSEVVETRSGAKLSRSASRQEIKDVSGDSWTYTRPMRALEINCGVGGSMRNMARFSGCSIVGITASGYHAALGTELNFAAGLGFQLDILQGDAQKLCSGVLSGDCHEAGFDCVYSFSTAHSPNRVELFSNIREVLPPGGMFAGYEFALTDRYDPRNAYHAKLKRGIEKGCGLASLAHYSHIHWCLEKSGFDVVEAYNLNASDSSSDKLSWHIELKESAFNLNSIDFHRTSWGRRITINMQRCLEMLHLVPKGAAEVLSLLDQAAQDLSEAGRLGIFTPCYVFVASRRE